MPGQGLQQAQVSYPFFYFGQVLFGENPAHFYVWFNRGLALIQLRRFCKTFVFGFRKVLHEVHQGGFVSFLEPRLFKQSLGRWPLGWIFGQTQIHQLFKLLRKLGEKTTKNLVNGCDSTES